MRSRFSLRASIVTALTGLLLSACNTGGSGTTAAEPEAQRVTPLEAVTLAATRTTEAKTAKFAATLKTTTGSGRTEVITVDGVVDYGSDRLKLTMRGGSDGDVEMVVDNSVYYVMVPGEEVVPGKKWFKLDLGALAESSGLDLDALAQGPNIDPTQALAYLKGASNDVKVVGKERLRGVETTHYTATLDLGKAVAQQPAAQRKLMEQALEQIKVKSFPADVWVDAEGRARKLRYKLAVQGTGDQSGEQATVDVTMEMFEFGTAVAVEKPPAGQTADLAELLDSVKDQVGG